MWFFVRCSSREFMYAARQEIVEETTIQAAAID
jgi:hypothetical protein